MDQKNEGVVHSVALSSPVTFLERDKKQKEGGTYRHDISRYARSTESLGAISGANITFERGVEILTKLGCKYAVLSNGHYTFYHPKYLHSGLPSIQVKPKSDRAVFVMGKFYRKVTRFLERDGDFINTSANVISLGDDIKDSEKYQDGIVKYLIEESKNKHIANPRFAPWHSKTNKQVIAPATPDQPPKLVVRVKPPKHSKYTNTDAAPALPDVKPGQMKTEGNENILPENWQDVSLEWLFLPESIAKALRDNGVNNIGDVYLLGDELISVDGINGIDVNEFNVIAGKINVFFETYKFQNAPLSIALKEVTLASFCGEEIEPMSTVDTQTNPVASEVTVKIPEKKHDDLLSRLQQLKEDRVGIVEMLEATDREIAELTSKITSQLANLGFGPVSAPSSSLGHIGSIAAPPVVKIQSNPSYVPPAAYAPKSNIVQQTRQPNLIQKTLSNPTGVAEETEETNFVSRMRRRSPEEIQLFRKTIIEFLQEQEGMWLTGRQIMDEVAGTCDFSGKSSPNTYLAPLIDAGLVRFRGNGVNKEYQYVERQAR